MDQVPPYTSEHESHLLCPVRWHLECRCARVRSDENAEHQDLKISV